MDFEFSMETVTLWPWSYHHYEPPGTDNHTDLYLCSASNRCDSCKARNNSPEVTSSPRLNTPSSSQLKGDTKESQRSSVVSREWTPEHYCKLFPCKECYICSELTEWLLLIIQWVIEGDDGGAEKTVFSSNLQSTTSATESDDNGATKLPSPYSTAPSVSIENSFTSSSSEDQDRSGVSFYQNECQQQLWSERVSYSHSFNSDLETGAIISPPKSARETQAGDSDSASSYEQFYDSNLSHVDCREATAGDNHRCQQQQKLSSDDIMTAASIHSDLQYNCNLQRRDAESLTNRQPLPQGQTNTNALPAVYGLASNTTYFVPNFVPAPSIPLFHGRIPVVPHIEYLSQVPITSLHLHGSSIATNRAHLDYYSSTNSCGCSRASAPLSSSSQQVAYDGCAKVDNDVDDLTFVFTKDCHTGHRKKSSSAPAGTTPLVSPRTSNLCHWINDNIKITPSFDFVPRRQGSSATARDPSNSTAWPTPTDPVMTNLDPVGGFNNNRRKSRSSRKSTSGKTVSLFSSISASSSNREDSASPANATSPKSVSDPEEGPLEVKQIRQGKHRPFILKTYASTAKSDAWTAAYSEVTLPHKSLFQFQPNCITVNLSRLDEMKLAPDSSPTQEEAELALEQESLNESPPSSGLDPAEEYSMQQDDVNIIKQSQSQHSRDKAKSKKSKGKKKSTEKAECGTEVKVTTTSAEDSKHIRSEPAANSSSSYAKSVKTPRPPTPTKPSYPRQKELNPDIRTPRAVRRRALQACKLNLYSLPLLSSYLKDTDLCNSDPYLSCDDDDADLSMKNLMRNDFSPEQTMRIKRKKKVGAPGQDDKTETHDMDCQTCK